MYAYISDKVSLQAMYICTSKKVYELSLFKLGIVEKWKHLHSLVMHSNSLQKTTFKFKHRSDAYVT